MPPLVSWRTTLTLNIGGSFSRGVDPVRPRLILAVDGLDKSGKTHFALTAPGPIAYQSIDFGMEGVVQKFAGKEIHVASYARLIPAEGRGDLEKTKSWVRDNFWNKFEADYKAALASKVRTIVWDTATEVHEMMRLMYFGKMEKILPQMYSAVNAHWQDLIRLAYGSNKNLLLLHHMKEEWREGKTTGNYVRAGNEKVSALVQAVLETRYIPRKVVKLTGEEINSARFEIEVTKCRQNPELVGQVLEGADFPLVAGMMLPEVEMESWEDAA